MNATDAPAPTRSSANEPSWLFVWVMLPAAVMSLGWGLRGYIGGGPFGAMIPGALIALVLCQNLGFTARAAATVSALSAIGIGLCGEMTYGQTLGLLRAGDAGSFWWGLLGTTLKGGVWGLLGGAMLGLGFFAHRMSAKALLIALLCLLAGTAIGLHFVNQPRLVYFSDPVNRPRDESWAGFLLGAAMLLGYLQVFQPRFARIAWTLAAYGAIGGAIGFGGGSLLLAMQPHLSPDWRWLPCWKFMEFTFGALFGAALGMATHKLRPQLVTIFEEDQHETTSQRNRGRWSAALNSAVVGALVVAGVFVVWADWLVPLEANWQSEALSDPSRAIARVLLGFTGLGYVLMLLSQRSSSVAWHVAISVTIVAAGVDWQRDLLPRGEIDIAPLYRGLLVGALAAISIAYVALWQTGRHPRLQQLTTFATCMLMGIGYLTAVSLSELWSPPAEQVQKAGGQLAYFWQQHRSEVLVHGIFTTLFVVSLWGILRDRRARATAKS